MELILVRHALPVRIDGTDDGCPADPGLSDRGYEQAKCLIDALAHDTVTHLYTSPARRARETAVPLHEALGLDLTVEDGLAEFDAAHSSYVPVEELRASGDPRWELLVKGDLYHGDVDPLAFKQRVITAIEQIVARHPGGRAVLFAHSGVINAYAGHVLAQDTLLWTAPAYASLTRIGAARDGRRGVISLNETGHVRDLL